MDTLSGNISSSNSSLHAGGDDALQLFSYIINVYVDGCFCLFGFLGNILILLVLRREKHATSNSILLQGLAVYDMCFLLYVVVYVVLRSVHAYHKNWPWLDAANPYIVAFVLPFGWTSQTCTIWLVMIVTVDRYWVVSRPLTGTLRCNPKNARIMNLGVAVLAILFNAIRWPRYYFVAFYMGDNSTFVSHRDAEIPDWDDEVYRQVYHLTLTLFFLFIIPLFVIIILNAKLMLVVKKALQTHRRLINNSEEEVSSHDSHVSRTRMLVVMISLFVVCELPDFIAGILGAGPFQISPTYYAYYAGAKEAMLVFNSAVNFYLYCIFYRTFRLSFFAMIGMARKDAAGDTTCSRTNRDRATRSLATRTLATSSLATSSLATRVRPQCASQGLDKQYVNEETIFTKM